MKVSLFATARKVSYISKAQILVRRNVVQCFKISKYGFFSLPCFPAFKLNKEIHKINDRVNVRIQSKFGKVLNRKNYVFRHFQRNARLL